MSKAKIREFISDNRANPELHNLHVRWHYELLCEVAKFREKLSASSLVPAAVLDGVILEWLQDEIQRDAATFEAAALVFAALPPPEGDSK